MVFLHEYTKERSCGHTVRWQPPTSQEETPLNRTNLATTLILDVPMFSIVRKLISVASLCFFFYGSLNRPVYSVRWD